VALEVEEGDAEETDAEEEEPREEFEEHGVSGCCSSRAAMLTGGDPLLSSESSDKYNRPLKASREKQFAAAVECDEFRRIFFTSFLRIFSARSCAPPVFFRAISSGSKPENARCPGSVTQLPA
jgi:hypothetical protein